ncbi:MAG: SAP domain-containing protein [Verrucomicrobiota bacterium]
MNCSDLCIYLSGLKGLASKNIFGKSTFVDETDRLRETFAPFGDIPLKDITTWVGKSFLTAPALINAIDEATTRKEMPVGFVVTLEKAGAPALKATAKHFGLSLDSKPTKADVVARIREFLTENGAAAERDSGKQSMLRIEHGMVADIERNALGALELLDAFAGEAIPKTAKKALVETIDLIIQFGGVEPFSVYVDRLAKQNPSSALGFHYAAKAGTIEPGVLRDLCNDLSVAELKKLCGWIGLPKSGAKAGLLERIARILQLPELAPEELVRLASYEYHQLRDAVGAKLDVDEALRLLSERLGVFGEKTLKQVAESEGFSSKQSKAKLLTTLRNHLGQIATTRTRG